MSPPNPKAIRDATGRHPLPAKRKRILGWYRKRREWSWCFDVFIFTFLFEGANPRCAAIHCIDNCDQNRKRNLSNSEKYFHTGNFLVRLGQAGLIFTKCYGELPGCFAICGPRELRIFSNSQYPLYEFRVMGLTPAPGRNHQEPQGSQLVGSMAQDAATVLLPPRTGPRSASTAIPLDNCPSGGRGAPTAAPPWAVGRQDISDHRSDG